MNIRKSRVIQLTIICLLIFGCSGGQDKFSQKDNDTSVPVDVATAVKRDVPVQVKAIGRVEAYSTVSVKPQVEGKLDKIYFREGEEVKKGDLLFQIDKRPFEAALKEAKAKLASDTAKLIKAKDDLKRYTELVDKGIVSKEQFQTVKSNYESLGETVKADKAVVEEAEINLDYTTIRAPIDGRTGAHLIDEGDVFKKNEEVLTDITQTKPIYVTFTAPEQVLPDIRKAISSGKKLNVGVMFPQEVSEDYDTDRKSGNDQNNTEPELMDSLSKSPIKGKLSFIDNKVDTTTGTIKLKAIFDNDDELLWPGQFVNVTLTLYTEKNAVVVPSSAIERNPDGLYAYVVTKDNVLESHQVVKGMEIGKYTVVKEGIKPGDVVVTRGHLQLKPGMRVETRKDTTLEKAGEGKSLVGESTYPTDSSTKSSSYQ